MDLNIIGGKYGLQLQLEEPINTRDNIYDEKSSKVLGQWFYF
jgi:hypothetical protein